MKSLNLRGIVLECFSHLNGQLTSWRQSQYLNVLTLRIYVGKQRQGECRRLPGARRCMSEDIPTVYQVRYRLALNRRRRFVADIVQHFY